MGSRSTLQCKQLIFDLFQIDLFSLGYCGMIETGATPFDAQQNALEACNRQCGGNPCVILYSDSDQVLCPRNDLTKPPGPQNPCLPLALLPQYKSSPLDNPSAASKNTALQYYMLWVTAGYFFQKIFSNFLEQRLRLKRFISGDSFFIEIFSGSWNGILDCSGIQQFNVVHRGF